MKKKLKNEDVENMIDEILYLEYRSMSIREITKRLEDDYGVKLSPQTVLKHLNSLKRRKRIEEKEDGEKI